ncbi:response regulator [Dermatobacter hominis]|uniref:response regulator n=1 Tax=Dermatobacter hominis TaxID=2884263 RepID=UPI001D12D831|nr:response regulator [Dermatobacter hominis]UDY37482.1 response regulator [Dermatobacter hominis]
MSASLEHLRVLLVDDDADQRFVLRRQLARRGITDVEEAADGASAVREAEHHRPDLVVLDLAMPGQSGMDVLPELQAVAADSRIVVLSNLPAHRVRSATERRGAYGFVSKRTEPDRVVEELLLAAALIDGSRRSTVRLGADRSAPSLARAMVRSTLDEAGEDLLMTAELLISELVTNAVEHAAAAPSVTLDLSPDRLRVEVADDDPRGVEPRSPRPDQAGGRGLGLVDRLADRWGQDATDRGKVVWFEIARR